MPYLSLDGGGDLVAPLQDPFVHVMRQTWKKRPTFSLKYRVATVGKVGKAFPILIRKPLVCT